MTLPSGRRGGGICTYHNCPSIIGRSPAAPETLQRLLALLDPDVVLQADPAAFGSPAEVRGAPAVARQFMRRAGAARSALVGGKVGVIVAPRGRLRLVLRITVTEEGKIASIAGVADPAMLQTIELAAFED